MSPRSEYENSDNQREPTFILEYCNCTRNLNFSGTISKESVKFEKTTCGIDAFQRGLHQKVAGFSFYGDAKSRQHGRKAEERDFQNDLRIHYRGEG